jgi:hypothetical protein
MERAFSMAAAGRDLPPGTATALGIRAWEQARGIILDEVLFPYNRLLGQKKLNDSADGFSARASAAFYEWLSTETPVDEEGLRAVVWAFNEVLRNIEAVRADGEQRWDQTRFGFLPYQLVLKPEEHDSQAELDALVERAVQEQFQDGNQVFYVENEQFQIEFARMVMEAEDYSVLWIHDVRGVNGAGEPDEVAYRQVVNVYLRALINAVQRYDETGKIPQHIIILDQWFFQANQGRLWMDLLQNPLHHTVRLPGEFREWAENIRAVQAELRAAIAESELLQAQAEHFPVGWIENLVKVHVNITNPADVTFWTGEILPLIGLPDMREALSVFYRQMAELNQALAEGDAEGADMEALTNALIPIGRKLVDVHLAELDPGAQGRAAMFLAVGSHNQNHRSFVMDGEVAFVVSSWAALNGLPDFITLAGLSVWVDSLEELEELFPRYEGIQRRISRWIRIVV